MSTGTEAYYQARAAEYDAVYAKPERQADLRHLREWLPAIVAGRRVLEVAAGTGYWTAGYADVAASVIATDVNAATLDVARARRAWPESVGFAKADAFDLTTVDGRFDAAVVGFFWSHVRLETLDEFLTALATRLDDHATVVFVDNRYVAGSNHPVTRTDSAGNTYQRRTLADGTRWEVLKNFPTVAQLEARLHRIGSAVTIEELTYYWTAVCTLG
jgi:SAM-dependent methyltransferase